MPLHITGSCYDNYRLSGTGAQGRDGRKNPDCVVTCITEVYFN